MGIFDTLGVPGISALFGSYAGDLYQDYKNYELQKDAFDLTKSQWVWQKAQYEQTKKREDNAIRRRVADLRAAGLSPVLAAGSAAVTSSAPSAPLFKAPQMDFKTGADTLSTAFQLQGQQASIAQTEAQTALTDAQIRKNPEEIRNLQSQAILNQANARRATVDANVAQHDLAIAKKMGTPVRSGTTGSLIKDVGGPASNYIFDRYMPPWLRSDYNKK